MLQSLTILHLPSALVPMARQIEHALSLHLAKLRDPSLSDNACHEVTFAFAGKRLRLRCLPLGPVMRRDSAGAPVCRPRHWPEAQEHVAGRQASGPRSTAREVGDTDVTLSATMKSGRDQRLRRSEPAALTKGMTRLDGVTQTSSATESPCHCRAKDGSNQQSRSARSGPRPAPSPRPAWAPAWL